MSKPPPVSSHLAGPRRPGSTARPFILALAVVVAVGSTWARAPILLGGFLTGAAGLLFLQRSRRSGPRAPFGWLAAAMLTHCATTLVIGLGRFGLILPDGLLRLNMDLRLATILAQAVALSCWPDAPGRPWTRWREVLDAILFTLSLLLAMCVLVLTEVMGASHIPLGDKARLVANFVGYSLLAGWVVYRSLNSLGRLRGPLGWLGAGFLAALGWNLVYGICVLKGIFPIRHGYFDLIPSLIPLCFLMAALSPLPGAEEGEALPFHVGNLLVPYLPLVLVLPSGMRLLRGALPRPDPFSLGLGVALVLVFVLRQISVILDLRRFNQDLARLVAERTRALEESQARQMRAQRVNLMAILGAGIAHDLNSLLGAVTVSADQLEETALAGRPWNPRPFQALKSACGKAEALLKRVLEAGRHEGVPAQTVDLNALLDDTAGVLENLITPGMELKLDLHPGALFLEGDPAHLGQVLVNLVANARDAMPGGGSITIRTGLGGDGGSFLSVEDQGTGIRPEDLPHIFEPLFTTKNPGRGTGLGLASVKAIVEASHGSIQVDTAAGSGTRFHLAFPPV